jgi:hypothetical protein
VLTNTGTNVAVTPLIPWGSTAHAAVGCGCLAVQEHPDP